MVKKSSSRGRQAAAAPPSPPSDRNTVRDQIKVEFGRRVYRLMINKGWNQSELARQADIARDDVSRYIRGVSIPTELKLVSLAKALDTTAAELLPGAAHGGSMATRPDTTPLVAFSMQTSPDDPAIAWLTVNRFVKIQTGLEIAKLLQNDNTPDRRASSR
jgi:transcriptional regulator with XRE-family HTH domain